ncbi:MAG TPA: hypothetical protein VM097_08455 [Mycobacteriales bacterium]|nr:hypothetical protein [Mycobacteriales bacterium]
MSRAVTRVATAAVTVTVTVLVTTLLTAAPALAEDIVGPLEGADPGEGLGPAATLLLFVVAPAAAYLLIAAVVLLPGAVRANRYRPAEGWSADPVWFAGPVDADAAIAHADRGDVTRGGAHGSW